MAPRLSVIMSAYNSAESIERAIESILDQSFADFELIILNDGSTDETEEKILSFSDERIRYIKLEHAGLTKALNHGISESVGEFVARHDSDDWSEPNRFSEQLKLFDDDPELGLVASWHNVVDPAGAYLGQRKGPQSDHELKKMMLWRNPFCHGSVLVRKSPLIEAGGYNESLTYSQDYDLWLRLAAAGVKFACALQPLYNLSISPESIARGWVKIENAPRIRENALKPINQQNFSISELPALGARRKASLWFYAIGSLALNDGRRRRALGYFVRSVAKNPTNWRAVARIVVTLLPTGVNRIFLDMAKKRRASQKPKS